MIGIRMINLPLNLVVQHFIQYVVAVQLTFYTLQMFSRYQYLHIFHSFVPEIEL